MLNQGDATSRSIITLVVVWKSAIRVSLLYIMNPDIGEDEMELIMTAFELQEAPIIHYDGSEHY
jgi:hypothetical protein